MAKKYVKPSRSLGRLILIAVVLVAFFASNNANIVQMLLTGIFLVLTNIMYDLHALHCNVIAEEDEYD